LPAVSIAKPDGILDGHPASSKLELFEGYVQKIVEMAKANPKVWDDTVIMVTFDEGGGYYDSGYVQPIDFFGDGTRIPLLVISKYSEGGHVVHTYYDHVSFDKFVEANWGLKDTDLVCGRSRDNLPNPVAQGVQSVCAGQRDRPSATSWTCSTSTWHCVDEGADPWVEFANIDVPNQTKCLRGDQHRRSTALDWSLSCPGATSATGKGRVDFDSPEHYTASITMKDQGEVVRVEGKRYAACTSPSD
jgi:hypothetical protein